MNLKNHTVGLAVGGLVGVQHLVWSLLVGLGLAERWINFVLGLHFVRLGVSIEPFRLGKAILLILVSFVIGYIMGWIFAALWNWVAKRKKNLIL